MFAFTEEEDDQNVVVLMIWINNVTTCEIMELVQQLNVPHMNFRLVV